MKTIREKALELENEIMKKEVKRLDEERDQQAAEIGNLAFENFNFGEWFKSKGYSLEQISEIAQGFTEDKSKVFHFDK